jgi:nucleotide-binding universal stress UspA family protein
MKKIVALVDLTEMTPKIVKMAQTLASALGSRVILLHVIPPISVVAPLGAEVPAVPEPLSERELAAQRAELQGLLDSLTARGVNATALQFEGPVVETVLEQTEKLNADLVIMGAHHHHAIYNFFVGSVAAKLLKRLPFPVLVVPADVLEKKEEETAELSHEEGTLPSAAVPTMMPA